MSNNNQSYKRVDGTACNIIYIIFFVGLVGLLFVPSFFPVLAAPIDGVKNLFKGDSLFDYYSKMIPALFKESAEFTLAYGILDSIKWVFFMVAGVIVLNLVVLIISLIRRGRSGSLNIFVMLLSAVAFAVATVVYNYKFSISIDETIKTILPFYLYFTVIMLFLFALLGRKSGALKSLAFLFSFVAIIGLVFKTFAFEGGTGELSGYYAFYLPEALKLSNHGDLLNIGLLMLGVKAAMANLISYIMTGVVVLFVINFIISGVQLVCRKKCKVLELIRFSLAFAAVAAVVVMLFVADAKLDLIRSIGLLIMLASSLALLAIAIVNAATGEKVALAGLDDGALKFVPESDESAGGTVAVEDAVVQDAEIPEVPEADSIYAEAPEVDETAEPEVEEEPVAEPEYDEEPAQLVMDNIPEPVEVPEVEAEKEPEVKSEPEKPAANQIDIETLKKEILADLYMKERTSTLAEDKAAPAPAYEIKPEPKPEPKPFINPYENFGYGGEVKSNVAAATPYARNAYGNISYNDIFFDSLTLAEKEEFDKIFLKKVYGDNKRLPDYVIGGDNKEFFSKVFIFIGRYRSIISEGLLSKIYLYSTTTK